MEQDDVFVSHLSETELFRDAPLACCDDPTLRGGTLVYTEKEKKRKASECGRVRLIGTRARADGRVI